MIPLCDASDLESYVIAQDIYYYSSHYGVKSFKKWIKPTKAECLKAIDALAPVYKMDYEEVTGVII